MVEPFGVEVPIIGVKDGCNDQTKSLNGGQHDSHMMDDIKCGSTHCVFNETLID